MSDSSPQPASATRKRLGCGGTIVLLALILALSGAFVFYRVEHATNQVFATGARDLRSLARNVRDAFVSVVHLQPEVTVNEEVIFTQTSPVLELAVINEQTVVERETSTSWLGSTKRVRLRGIYNIKAGYDLRQPFAVQMDSTHPDKIVANLPRAKILSVEQQKVDVLAMDNGVWNHVNADDLTTEINELNLDARLKAQRGGIAEKAEKSLAQQLKDKLGPTYDLEVISAAGFPVSPSPTVPTVKP